VTGKLDYPSAAWRGAMSGAVPGALLGWIFGLFDWADPLVSAFCSLSTDCSSER
jgi:hypothetical protein